MDGSVSAPRTPGHLTTAKRGRDHPCGVESGAVRPGRGAGAHLQPDGHEGLRLVAVVDRIAAGRARRGPPGRAHELEGAAVGAAAADRVRVATGLAAGDALRPALVLLRDLALEDSVVGALVIRPRGRRRAGDAHGQRRDRECRHGSEQQSGNRSCHRGGQAKDRVSEALADRPHLQDPAQMEETPAGRRRPPAQFSVGDPGRDDEDRDDRDQQRDPDRDRGDGEERPLDVELLVGALAEDVLADVDRVAGAAAVMLGLLLLSGCLLGELAGRVVGERLGLTGAADIPPLDVAADNLEVAHTAPLPLPGRINKPAFQCKSRTPAAERRPSPLR